jgi:hypothetical protein
MAPLTSSAMRRPLPEAPAVSVARILEKARRQPRATRPVVGRNAVSESGLATKGSLQLKSRPQPCSQPMTPATNIFWVLGPEMPGSYTGQPFPETEVARFTAARNGGIDSNPGDFQAVIHWGDGTSSPGTVAPYIEFGYRYDDLLVLGSHTYYAAGVYPITVDIIPATWYSEDNAVVNEATVVNPPSQAARAGPGVLHNPRYIPVSRPAFPVPLARQSDQKGHGDPCTKVRPKHKGLILDGSPGDKAAFNAMLETAEQQAPAASRRVLNQIDEQHPVTVKLRRSLQNVFIDSFWDDWVDLDDLGHLPATVTPGDNELTQGESILHFLGERAYRAHHLPDFANHNRAAFSQAYKAGLTIENDYRRELGQTTEVVTLYRGPFQANYRTIRQGQEVEVVHFDALPDEIIPLAGEHNLNISGSPVWYVP